EDEERRREEQEGREALPAARCPAHGRRHRHRRGLGADDVGGGAGDPLAFSGEHPGHRTSYRRAVVTAVVSGGAGGGGVRSARASMAFEASAARASAVRATRVPTVACSMAMASSRWISSALYSMGRCARATAICSTNALSPGFVSR